MFYMTICSIQKDLPLNAIITKSARHTECNITISAKGLESQQFSPPAPHRSASCWSHDNIREEFDCRIVIHQFWGMSTFPSS